MLRDGFQPAVVDALAVVRRHRGVGVAHDEVDGDGIAGGVGDGAEDVSQRVEADAVPIQRALL